MLRIRAALLCLLGLVVSGRVGCFAPSIPSRRPAAPLPGHSRACVARQGLAKPLGGALARRPLGASAGGVPGLRAQADAADAGDRGGVQLPSGDVKEVSAWLSAEVRQWLDDEWIPRDIHREIGEIAAGAYESARERGVNEAGDILMEVANTMMEVNLYEADVGAFDIANKVTDLLLINDGRDVCCTSQPYNAAPGAIAQASDGFVVPAEAEAWARPDSSFDRYQFLQQLIDGRTHPAVIDRAVLESLGYEVRKGADSAVYDSSGVTDDRALGIKGFMGNEDSCEILQDMLEESLEEQNKDEEDLVPLVEALVGEAALRMAKEEGDVDFAMREVCVKWLHFAGGY